MAAMAMSSMVVKERVVIVMVTRANIREIMVERGESIQIMIGAKLASLYRA